MKCKLGDTVVFNMPRPYSADINQSLKEFFEEEAWHNDPLNNPMPKHIVNSKREICLTTQEMVDEYNETGTLKSLDNLINCQKVVS